MTASLHWGVIMSLMEKRRTTVYISPEVLEFLSLRRIKGAGSVSQQLENLARATMPVQTDIATLEQRHKAGYERIPVNGEFDDLLAAQVFDVNL